MAFSAAAGSAACAAVRALRLSTAAGRLAAPVAVPGVRALWSATGVAPRSEGIAGVPSALPSAQAAVHTVQSRFRSRAGIPSWRKKAARRGAAREVREAVKFAARFDALRSARNGVLRTLGKMGWPMNRGEAITEGVQAFAAMKHMYLVIDVVPEAGYIPGTDVLTPEVQARYDLIRSKGWKVVLVRQGAWNKGLVVQQAPFETRRDAVFVSHSDYGVYDKMKKAAAKHGSQYGIGGIVRGKGRVRMRVRRSRQ